MLPKPYRLPKERIPVVFSSGKRCSVPPVLGYLLQGQSGSRFAIVVNKRSAKLATQRTRIKRSVRNSLIQITTLLTQPIDAVLVIQQLPQETSQEQMHTYIYKMFAKAGLV